MNHRITRASVAAVVCSMAIAGTAVRLHAGAGDPTLPQKTVDTTYPTITGQSRAVHQGDNLQSIINQANPGDEVVIDAGATFDNTSPIILPAKSGSSYIVIRTSNLSSLPPSGTRVSPSDAVNMPKILINATNQSTIQTDTSGPASYYRLVGLEVSEDPAGSITSGSSALIKVGTGTETSTSQLANHVIVDRCYVHGNPSQQIRNGIVVNGEYVGVVDSYISNVHLTTDESHGILGFNGDGPILIQDDYIEAAGQNIMFGGADALSSSLIPSDITIEQSSLYRKPCWRPGDPTYVNPYNGDYSCGIQWQVKNILELKDAQRILVDGNIMEYVWVSAQHGDALELTVRNQNNNTPYSILQDLTIRYNTIRHAARGVNITGDDDTYKVNAPTQRVKIYNNLFYDIDPSWTGTGSAGDGWDILLQSSTFLPDGPEYVTFDHNTMVDAGSVYMYVVPDNAANIPNFTFTNNIVPHQTYGVKGDAAGSDDNLLTSSWFATGLTFAGNLIEGSPDGTNTWQSSYYAHTNEFFQTTWTSPQVFKNMNTTDSADYTVIVNDIGTDGAVVGADTSAIAAHQTSGGGSGPSSWTDQDIGSVGLAGGSTFSNGVVTEQGAGADIWGTADSFHFRSLALAGDGQVVAEVTSITNTNTYAKAGVMLRDGLDPSAAMVILDVKPDGGVEFMQRSSAGGSVAFLDGGNAPPPYWVRLQRSGSTVTASVSPDGATWTTIGSTTATMSSSVDAGLAVCSHDTTQLNTSTFAGASVTPGASANQNIGAVGLIGNAAYSNGVFTVMGSGADIWGTADAFDFVSQPVAGDNHIIARVQSLQNTNTYAKVGLMLRDGSSASAPMVILDIKPDGGVEFMQRASAGGSVTFLDGGSAPAPYWVQLQRSGSTITASVSPDGATWTTIGSTTASMSSTISVGLVVCSHDTTKLDTAVFTNVSIQQP